jgi:transcriptional regulator with XRE-family HTH domain
MRPKGVVKCTSYDRADIKAFGDGLRQIRLKRRIKVTEMARGTQLGKGTIFTYESGKYLPNALALLCMLRYLDASFNELMEEFEKARIRNITMGLRKIEKEAKKRITENDNPI